MPLFFLWFLYYRKCWTKCECRVFCWRIFCFSTKHCGAETWRRAMVSSSLVPDCATRREIDGRKKIGHRRRRNPLPPKKERRFDVTEEEKVHDEFGMFFYCFILCKEVKEKDRYRWKEGVYTFRLLPFPRRQNIWKFIYSPPVLRVLRTSGGKEIRRIQRIRRTATDAHAMSRLTTTTSVYYRCVLHERKVKMQADSEKSHVTIILAKVKKCLYHFGLYYVTHMKLRVRKERRRCLELRNGKIIYISPI